MSIVRRIDCRCASCKHALLATQSACPECGHIDAGRVITGYAWDRGLRSSWKSVLIALTLLAMVIAAIVVPTQLLGSLTRFRFEIIVIAVPVGALLCAALALRTRDALRRVLFEARECFVEWRITDRELSVNGERLFLWHVTGATCDSSSKAGHCLVVVSSDELRFDGSHLWRVWVGSDQGRSRAIRDEILLRATRQRELRHRPGVALEAEAVSLPLARPSLDQLSNKD